MSPSEYDPSKPFIMPTSSIVACFGLIFTLVTVYMFFRIYLVDQDVNDGLYDQDDVISEATIEGTRTYPLLVGKCDPCIIAIDSDQVIETNNVSIPGAEFERLCTQVEECQQVPGMDVLAYIRIFDQDNGWLDLRVSGDEGSWLMLWEGPSQIRDASWNAFAFLVCNLFFFIPMLVVKLRTQKEEVLHAEPEEQVRVFK